MKGYHEGIAVCNVLVMDSDQNSLLANMNYMKSTHLLLHVKYTLHIMLNNPAIIGLRFRYACPCTRYMDVYWYMYIEGAWSVKPLVACLKKKLHHD